jgi:hypothetical protein
MATVSSYYSNKNFLDIMNAIDIALFGHFSALLFDGDQTRIQYSSNAYALRKRSDGNKGNLNLPFFNFKRDDYDPGLRTWWNARAYTTGVYVSELEQKIIAAPVTISYEASFWCHRADELRYAFSEIIFDSDNKTIIDPNNAIIKPKVEIDGEDVFIPILLNYENTTFDPTYDETDWLERNKIHTAEISFTVDSFALKTNTDITIPETVVFEFAYQNSLEVTNYDETLTRVINHVTEEVEDS